MTARKTAYVGSECIYCGSIIEEKEILYVVPWCPKDGQLDYGEPKKLNPGVSGEGDS